MIQSFSLMLMSCIFIFILVLYFTSKAHLKTLELKLYKQLLISNLIGLILEMLCSITIGKLPQYSPITIAINKIYLLYFIFFATTFSVYVFLISSNNDDGKLIFEKANKYRYVIMILMAILVLYFPIELNYGKIAYSYGPAVNIIYVYAFVNIILCIIWMIGSIKQIKYKKYIPLIIYIFGSGIVGFIQRLNPEFTLSTTMDAIVLFIMYFTIENPDLTMVEELHRSKEISDSANEEKTMFLYNMTQEIRGFTDKINDDADIILNSKDWEETYDSARDIKGTTSNLTNMTNDILDVGSIDESNIKVYNTKYNIKNVLKQLVTIYSDICKNKMLEFRTNIDHDIPETLYGDGINLKEILTVILNNSTKYTSAGYVEFNVNTIIKNDICRLIFTIEDSGVGIKSEDINKIKVDNKSLSKANKMITLMNGTMIISSDYGYGTKVKVIIDQKMETDTNSEVAKYEGTFDNISVLAIDDSESGLKIIEKLLKGTEIKLDLASTGKESIDKVKINKYDLILLDEDLSQISGMELMTKLKEIRNFKTPVILLTKDNSYEYNEEYTNAGFTSYILKPLKKDKLLELIDKYTKEDNA